MSVDKKPGGSRSSLKFSKLVIHAENKDDLIWQFVSILARLPQERRAEFLKYHKGRIETVGKVRMLSRAELTRAVFRAYYTLDTMRHTEHQCRPKTIAVPPGYKLAAVLRFLLTAKTYKRFVEPVIADMQHEYIEALIAGHRWHARWIAVRGHLLAVPGWAYAFLASKLGELLRRGQ